MADRNEIKILDEDSLREVAERIRELQAMHKNVREMLAALRREPYGHVIRTVKTSTRAPDWIPYPDEGSVFPFQFEDWDFDETPGASGLANTDEWAGKKPIGQIWGSQWVPEGTRLLAVKLPSATKGRQWWGFQLPQPLIRFELTATLCAATSGAGGSATAQRIDGDLAQIDDDPEITVFDAVGFWHGKTGYQGWAVWMQDAARYEIVFLEALARFIEFTLGEDMTSGCSVEGYGDTARSVTVDRYWGGAPNNKNPDTGQGISVYDRAELFPLALTGAKGFAIYDELHATATNEDGEICDGRYIVVQCDQQTLWMEAQASFDYCCEDYTWEIESPLEGTAAPFSQRPAPEPTEALNIWGLAAEAADSICVIFSHLYCDWLVLQVTHKCIDVITAFRLYDPGADCKKLQLGRREIAVAYCSPDVTWPAGAGAGVYELVLSAVDIVNAVTFTGLDGDTTGAMNSGECALTQSVRRVCLLDDSAGAADPRVTEIMQFAEADVVTDVFDTGSALGQTVQAIYVACIGVSANEGIITTTDCDTGTGGA